MYISYEGKDRNSVALKQLMFIKNGYGNSSMNKKSRPVKGRLFIINVSSTNSKEFKLCVNSSFNIDTRLFRKTAIRSQCSKHVDNEIIETSMP